MYAANRRRTSSSAATRSSTSWYRMMEEMDVNYPLLCDPTEVLDIPSGGEYRMFDGGTSLDEMKDAPNAIDTLLLKCLTPSASSIGCPHHSAMAPRRCGHAYHRVRHRCRARQADPHPHR